MKVETLPLEVERLSGKVEFCTRNVEQFTPKVEYATLLEVLCVKVETLPLELERLPEKVEALARNVEQSALKEERRNYIRSSVHESRNFSVKSRMFARESGILYS